MEYFICGLIVLLCTIYVVRKLIGPTFRECEICHVQAEMQEMGWGVSLWVCPNCGKHVE